MSYKDKTVKDGALSFKIEYSQNTDDVDVSHLGEAVSETSDLPHWDRAAGALVVDAFQAENGEMLYQAFNQNNKPFPEYRPDGFNWSDRHSGRFIVEFQNGVDTEDGRFSCIEDAKRLDDFYNDKWFMLDLKVTATVDGQEVGDSVYLGGIEDDSGDAHFREIEKEQIAECKAGLKKSDLKALVKHRDALTASVKQIRRVLQAS